MAGRTFKLEFEAITSNAERGFRKLAGESENLTGKLKRTERASLEVRDAALRVESAQQKAARAASTYGSDSLKAAQANVQLEKAQQRLQSELGQTSRHASIAGAAVRKVGDAAKFAAGTAGVAGLGIGLSKAVGATVDFDRAMRNVNSIAQLNEKDFGKLEKQVLALAGKTAQAPKTLAEGLYDLESSGFNAKQSMVILASSAKAATAGLTDTATSTKAVAAVLNAYHRPAKDAAQVSDDLFQTVNRGVISFQELSTTIGDVLPFASSLGVGLKPVGAAISTMTKEGLSGAEATTRLKNTMVALIKPSTDMQKAIKQLGYNSGESLVKAKGFQGAIEALVGTTDGSKASVAKLFPNIRALGGALALTGKNTKSAEGDLKNFKNTSGATNKALSQQSQSISYQWNKVKAEVSAFAIKAGLAVVDFAKKNKDKAKQIVEDLKPVLRTFKDIASWVTAHPHIVELLGGGLLAGKAFRKLGGGGGPLGGGGGLVGAATRAVVGTKPIPVFVVNEGFGKPGVPGAPGRVGGIEAVKKVLPFAGAAAVPLTVALIGSQHVNDQFKGFTDAIVKNAGKIQDAIKANDPEFEKFRQAVQKAADVQGGPFASDAKKALGMLNRLEGQTRQSSGAIRDAADANYGLGRSMSGQLEKADKFANKVIAIGRAGRDASGAFQRLHDKIQNLPQQARINIIASVSETFRIGPHPGGKSGTTRRTDGTTFKSAPGAATGAFITGPAGAGDIVPLWTMPGEVVLTPEQQSMVGRDRIFSALSATGAKMIGPGDGASTGGLVGGAADLYGYLSRMGYRPTSTTGGRHAPNSYHYRGEAIDYGTSANNVRALANVLWPYRGQFAELFIPTWAPHGGLYHFGAAFSDPSLQAQHQDHIHVADTRGSFGPGAKLGVSRRRPSKPNAMAGKGSGYTPLQGKAKADNLPSYTDTTRHSDFESFYQAALTKAQITTPNDTSDDLTVLRAWRQYEQQKFDASVRSGNAQGIIDAGGQLQNIDQQITDLTAAPPTPGSANDLAGIKAALDEMNARAKAVVGTQDGVLTQWVTQQLMTGAGVTVGLGAQMPSSPGVLARLNP